jgi:uncharacterized protein
MSMREVVAQQSHRPWPMPSGPWVMTQWWRDLLFAHWPLPAAQIQALLPPPLEVDCYDGQAWVGVVPFRMSGVRPRFTPAVPALSDFAELNVRTYVRPRGGGHPGVYFWSLEANNPLAVWAARTFFHLPYQNAEMICQSEGAAIQYRSRRTHRGSPPALFEGRYGGGAPVPKDHLSDFLTERYCLYTTDGQGQLYRGDIHHQTWPLESGWADIRLNTMAEAAGILLPSQPPLLHFVRGIEVAIWPLRKLSAG